MWDLNYSSRTKSFLNELYSLAVVNQMQIHGIRNLAVSFDGFLVQGATGCFNKQRNRAGDHRNQSRNNDIFAAQSNRCMEFDIFVCVILMFI